MYSFSSRIRYSECDESLRLTIPGFLNYFQDCSMFHCEHIGHGFSYCDEHDFAWFVLAWQIRVDRLPEFGEQVQISTWCYDMTSTAAKRYFTMTDAQGNQIIQADSLVVAFDTVRGRAGRIPESEFVFVSDDGHLDLPPTKRKIRLEGPGMPLFDLEVTERLIDTNGHVNNVRYVAIAEDAIRMRDTNFKLGKLYVQYRASARLGDTMHIMLHEEPCGYAVNLADDAGKSYAVVRLERAD